MITQTPSKVLNTFLGRARASPTLASWTLNFHIYIICHTSFRKCKLTLWIRNVAHADFKCGRNIEKNTWSLPSSFTFIILGYNFCYPWIPRTVLEEPSSQRRNKKSLKIETAQKWNRAQRATETSKQRSEKAKGERYTAQTASERQATLQWKNTR